MAALPPGTATGPAKLKAVTSLVDRLALDFEEPSLTAAERESALEELKIYGRDVRHADALYSSRGLNAVLQHAFQSSSSPETSTAALKVFANAMLLDKSARQLFVDQLYPAKACNLLTEESWDKEFLLSRMLFLTTYETSVDLASLIEEHELAQRVIQNLNRHVVFATSGKQANSMEEMALVETSKLLFNVTHFSPQHQASFTPAIAPLVALLWKHDIPATKPLDTGLSHLTNGLLNLDLDNAMARGALFPEGKVTRVVSRLIEILDRAMKSYDGEADVVVAPLVGLLIQLHAIAPDPVLAFMRESLLPSADDREAVLGESSSLPSRLLKCSTDPLTPKLGYSSSQLLFDLSDKDASKFVDNVGYGYASGFLFQNNIAMPQMLTDDAGGSQASTSAQRTVNPITGQFVDKEKEYEGPEMTREEKEREAEKLFVLFERLKQNGIIDVQNPVEKAVQEGRFEELSDSEDDDETRKK